MTPNEEACLTAALENGPLLRTPSGYRPVDWVEGDSTFGARTVMGLARIGLLLMPDSTQAWIANPGREALKRWAEARARRPTSAAA